jgi:hypothetical protein
MLPPQSHIGVVLVEGCMLEAPGVGDEQGPFGGLLFESFHQRGKLVTLESLYQLIKDLRDL